MTEGLFALAGAFLGGGLPILYSFYANRQARAKRLRTLARLLAPRVSAAVQLYEPGLILGSSKGGSSESVKAIEDFWEAYEHELADGLDQTAWQRVSDGVSAARTLAAGLTDDGALERKILQLNVSRLREARAILCELGGIDNTDERVGAEIMSMLNDEFKRQESGQQNM